MEDASTACPDLSQNKQALLIAAEEPEWRLSKMSLCHGAGSIQVVRILSAGIKRGTGLASLTSLDLSHNFLRNEGVRELALYC